MKNYIRKILKIKAQTWWKVISRIILGLNIIFILYFAIRFFDQLDNFTRIITLIWGVVSAVVTYLFKFGESTGSKISENIQHNIFVLLREFILVLNPALLLFFILLFVRTCYDTPVHFEVMAQNSSLDSVRCTYENGEKKDPDCLKVNGSTTIEFPIGTYRIIPDTSSFEYQSTTFRVNWYDFESKNIPLNFQTRMGKILFKNTVPGSYLSIRRARETEYEASNIRIEGKYYLSHKLYYGCYIYKFTDEFHDINPDSGKIDLNKALAEKPITYQKRAMGLKLLPNIELSGLKMYLDYSPVQSVRKIPIDRLGFHLFEIKDYQNRQHFRIELHFTKAEEKTIRVNFTPVQVSWVQFFAFEYAGMQLLVDGEVRGIIDGIYGYGTIVFDGPRRITICDGSGREALSSNYIFPLPGNLLKIGN